MFKNPRVILFSVLVVAALIVAYLLADRQGWFASESTDQDTLSAIEQLTPEIASLSEQIRNAPSNAGLFYSRGNAYYDFGNLKYAESDYARAFELDSNNATYVLGWSDCLFDMNEVSKAVEMLENYQLRIPGNPDIMFSLAVDYFLLPQPKYPQSIDLLNEILKQDIQNAPAYFYKGLVFKEWGDTTKAISSFQTCTEVDPDYYDAWLQLGLLYADKGDPLAVNYFDNAIAVSDSSREAEYAKAKYFQDKGNLAEAIEYYRQMVIKDPQDADALYNLATIYFGVDSIVKADRYFDMAIKQSPAKAYAHYGKGLCSMKLGHNKEAVAYFQQAITLGVDEETEAECNELIRQINGN